MKNILTSFVIAGIVLTVLGLYLCIVKGGIPYQDPTVDMIIEWKAYHTAGEYNLKAGLVLILTGAVGKLVESRFKK